MLIMLFEMLDEPFKTILPLISITLKSYVLSELHITYTLPVVGLGKIVRPNSVDSGILPVGFAMCRAYGNLGTFTSKGSQALRPPTTIEFGLELAKVAFTLYVYVLNV